MRRYFIRIMLILVLCALVLAYVAVKSNDTPLTQIEYTVRAGDTLWGIAEEYAPESYDEREYIYEVKKINGLGTGHIYPGMRLNILTSAK